VPRLRLEEIEELAFQALAAASTEPRNARPVAASIAAAEADAIPSHGLLRLPTYCAHASSGKVDGHAQPILSQTAPGALQVDARNGFAHPAIDMALTALAALAVEQGIAAVAIRNSYNSGVMGHHVERLARRSLVALGFANAPAVIAPWGGNHPLLGTNPIAFAAPSEGSEPVVIDQASSVVARGEILLRAQRREDIPDTWGLDREGRPTSDPKAVLEGGSLAPAGGHKGATLALIVEILAATLTGSLSSAKAGSLTSPGDPRRAGVGQLFVAINPEHFAASGLASRVRELCESISAQPGARIPGMRRFAARAVASIDGVAVDDDLYKVVTELTRASG
jgi:(2R)-3-sulfolactate dehydrogenase (NADP+)